MIVIFRLVFFLLVFLNLVFFAWAEGYFGATDAGREPQRLARQLHPEKLRIIHESDDPASPATPSAVPVEMSAPAAAIPKKPAASSAL